LHLEDEHGADEVSTAAEFAGHRPHGEDGRVDEQFVRILFVEERADFADRIRGILGRCSRGSFEVVRESDLVKAASQIRGDTFDLLLLDLSLATVDRAAAIELATDLAHRLPVVVLTGTEALLEADIEVREGVERCIESADVPGKLLSAIRRYRRLGTAIMTPTFCRIERLCTTP
jgi:DNA-binding NtrC family response regulator